MINKLDRLVPLSGHTHFASDDVVFHHFLLLLLLSCSFWFLLVSLQMNDKTPCQPTCFVSLGACLLPAGDLWCDPVCVFVSKGVVLEEGETVSALFTAKTFFFFFCWKTVIGRKEVP
jgi:hypothetical protein